MKMQGADRLIYLFGIVFVLMEVGFGTWDLIRGSVMAGTIAFIVATLWVGITVYIKERNG